MKIIAFIGYLGWAVLVLLVGGFIVEERRLMEKRIAEMERDKWLQERRERARLIGDEMNEKMNDRRFNQ